MHKGSVGRVPHFGVDIGFQFFQATVVISLEHHLIPNLKQFHLRNIFLKYAMVYLQIFLDTLFENLCGKVSTYFSNFNIFRERCSPGKILFINKLDKGLIKIVIIQILNPLYSSALTSAALLIIALVTTPVWPRAAPRASPGKMYLPINYQY